MEGFGMKGGFGQIDAKRGWLGVELGWELGWKDEQGEVGWI